MVLVKQLPLEHQLSIKSKGTTFGAADILEPQQ
jgi:hypothetical protein